MLWVRRLLFGTFVIAYIIICPLLVLYALGYIYSPVAGELVHTGVLYVDSVPSGADIYLEKSRFSHRTPATIEELLPGSYKISLRKKGYNAWTHSVTIEPGKAVAFKNVLLIPRNWPQKDITTQSYKDLVPIDNEQLFLITTGPNLDNFFVYNLNGDIRPLLPPESPFSALPVIKVHHVAKSDAIVIYGGTFWDKKYLYLNLKDKEPNAIDITKFLPDEPSFITWQAKNQTTLFARQKNCISRLDVETSKIFPCYLENIKGFGLYDNYACVIDANDLLIRHSLDTHKQENLSEDIRLAKRLLDRSEFYHIDVKNTRTIFFMGTEGDFLVNLPPYYIAPKDVIGYRFSANTDLLLYWTKTSLTVADFSVGRDKTVFHENFKIQTVYQNGRNLKQAFWADDNSHILCNDADTVYLIELLPQGDPHVQPVIKIKNNTKVFYNLDENALYCLDQKSGVLKQLRIIPKQPLTTAPLRKMRE
jgi:hypothetical protein